MRDFSPTPNIVVMIGGQVRVYYAYITTAGPELDGPSTMTLRSRQVATEPDRSDTSRGNTPRLVLMTERARSHRALSLALFVLTMLVVSTRGSG